MYGNPVMDGHDDRFGTQQQQQRSSSAAAAATAAAARRETAKDMSVQTAGLPLSLRQRQVQGSG